MFNQSRNIVSAVITAFATLTTLVPAFAQDIIIGQSVPLTGPAQALGKEMQSGIQAYFKVVNANGGINGRNLVLKTLDDGYEPERTVANTKQLIEKDGALALLGYVGTPTSVAALPIFTEAKVPFIGAFTGAEVLRAPFNKQIFNIRASYYEETELIVEHLHKLSLNRVAVFYQNDAYGKAGLEGVNRALKKRGLTPVAIATVERNSVDVAAAVDALGKTDAQTIIMISAYKSCATFIKAMIAKNKRPNFVNVSFVGTKALATELGPLAVGTQISQVMPYPWDDGSRLIREYQAAMKGVDGDINYSTLEGYVAARVLVEGFKRDKGGLDRAGLIAGLESLRDFDLGGFKVDFSPTDHNGSNFVQLTIVSKDGRIKR